MSNKQKRKKEKHAVPCISTGHVFIVSASESRVTTWIHGFKTKPKKHGYPHLTSGNGIAQRALHCWSQPSLCSINQMSKTVAIDDEDINKNLFVHLHQV